MPQALSPKNLRAGKGSGSLRHCQEIWVWDPHMAWVRPLSPTSYPAAARLPSPQVPTLALCYTSPPLTPIVVPQGPSLTDSFCWHPLLQLLTLLWSWGKQLGRWRIGSQSLRVEGTVFPTGTQILWFWLLAPYLYGPCPSPLSICHLVPLSWGCCPPFWVSLKGERWEEPVTLGLGFRGHVGKGSSMHWGQMGGGQAWTGDGCGCRSG